MDWLAIFNGALGAGVLAIALKLIDAYSNRGKTRADAAKTIVEGGAQAVNTMRELLNDYDRINDEQAAEIKELKERLKERDKLNAARDAQIAGLQAQITDADDRNEALQAKLAGLQAQIDKDTRETAELRLQVLAIEEKYKKQLRINVKLVKALEDAKIPLPDFNGDMGDSIRGLKWDK